MGRAALSIVLLLSVALRCSGELVVNGGFETEVDGTDWACFSCTLERDGDAFEGSFSGRVTNREANWAGATQYISPNEGASYQVSARIKLLNQDSDKLWHKVEVMVQETFNGGQEVYTLLGESPHVRFDSGWVEVGGDMTFSSGYESVRLYIQLPEANINYLLDAVTMTEIPVINDWENEANQRIEQYRKGDVTFNLQADNPAAVELQFNMVRHAFPFGTALVADYTSDTSGNYKAYQDFFYNNFNYAVLENALKWKQMEPNQDDINYARPDEAINVLGSNGIPVRGHCVSWGVEERVPDWLFGMNPDQIQSEISDRITGVVSHFQDRLVHWDVDNENLHGAWFEGATGQHDLLAQMFRDVNQVDPNVKLFINDFNVVSTNQITNAFKQMAVDLVNVGAPIYGVGIQSHIDYSGPPIHVLKHRMDKVAEAGLPIWITELDVRDDDVNSRADRYEDILRLYFSLPSVEGILIWGFWDRAHWRPECALAEGDNVTPNAAGERWQQLLFNEWSTNLTFEGNGGLTAHAFIGDYRLTVLYNGEVIQEQSVTVGPGSNVFDVIV